MLSIVATRRLTKFAELPNEELPNKETRSNLRVRSLGQEGAGGSKPVVGNKETMLNQLWRTVTNPGVVIFCLWAALMTTYGFLLTN